MSTYIYPQTYDPAKHPEAQWVVEDKWKALGDFGKSWTYPNDFGRVSNRYTKRRRMLTDSRKFGTSQTRANMLETVESIFVKRETASDLSDVAK